MARGRRGIYFAAGTVLLIASIAVGSLSWLLPVQGIPLAILLGLALLLFVGSLRLYGWMFLRPNQQPDVGGFIASILAAIIQLVTYK